MYIYAAMPLVFRAIAVVYIYRERKNSSIYPGATVVAGGGGAAVKVSVALFLTTK